MEGETASSIGTRRSSFFPHSFVPLCRRHTNAIKKNCLPQGKTKTIEVFPYCQQKNATPDASCDGILTEDYT